MPNPIRSTMTTLNRIGSVALERSLGMVAPSRASRASAGRVPD